MAVYAYAPGADDFDSMGLCGPLTPTRCEFTEKRNGLSQLVLDHPIDETGRWAVLVPGCVLKAEVPVRTTPEIDGTTLVTTVEKWKIKTIATEGQRKLWSKSSGGRLIKTLPVWADKAKTHRFEVTVVRKGGSRYKARTRYGSGWIPVSGIEYSVTNTIPNDPAAIETVEPAWTVKPQLFRIREAAVTDAGVSVTASHIFYDLAGNITTWSGYDGATKTNNPTCAQALAGLMGGCAVAHEFEGYTNLTDQRVDVAWTRANAVEALLAPETGLVDRWGVELVRDNYEFYLLREAGKNRGVRIEYGKNLLGVECTTDATGVITRIMPVGKTSKDKPLLLAAGTYNINGTIVTIGAGETWVTSPLAGDHPGPMMTVLETNVKAKSGSSGDVSAARKKMIEAALSKFTDEQCDQPSVNLRVEFVSLGDMVEYEQYKRLDDVYLCDRVRVRHPGIKVDALTEVIETVWDCLRSRFKSVELGRVQLDKTRVKTPVWQLPTGIPGTLVAPGTVDAGALADDVGSVIDVSGNPSVSAAVVRVAVSSSAGNVLGGQTTTAGSVLSARVYRGGVEVTNDLNASLFSWARESGNAPADAAWAAAHVGVKSVSVTAAEFASAPAIYHCDVADEPKEA
jgi:phage minor structural protein